LQNLAICAFPRTGQRNSRILSSFVRAHLRRNCAVIAALTQDDKKNGRA
jgi:hypothetical protein